MPAVWGDLPHDTLSLPEQTTSAGDDGAQPHTPVLAPGTPQMRPVGFHSPQNDSRPTYFSGEQPRCYLMLLMRAIRETWQTRVAVGSDLVSYFNSSFVLQ